jgi:septal ring factor EnvC (AmiA/AmiB activator)
MRVPFKNGRFMVIEFDPRETHDFAPLLKMSGAEVSQQAAPLRLKPLRESGAGAPLLHSATTSSQERRSPSPSRGVSWQKSKPQKSLQDELQECREVLAEKASELAIMDSRLAPARADETDIREAIVATHDRRDGVVILNLGTRGERSPLFAKLDKISKEWGPLKNERKNLFCEIKTIERQIDHIKRSIERANRKKARA